MNLRTLSDKNLLENLKNLVCKEREVTIETLHHLREVERRCLYAKMAYSSLFEYVVKELKYSESAAQRRISSMRLLNEIPEIENKVPSGALTLSALSQAQTFFRQEKEKIKSVEEKVEILELLENKTLHQVQRELLSRSSNPASLVSERVKVVSETHSEIKFLAEAGLLNDIEELRNLLSHSKPGASIKYLIAFAVSRAVNELRPKAPKHSSVTTAVERMTASGGSRLKVSHTKNAEASAQRITQKMNRYIKCAVKHQVWQRDRGQCTFSDPVSARKCCSKYKVEFDHIVPFAMGGQNSVENLRLRCQAHNQFSAIQFYGAKKMAQHVPRIK
jgi:5-methylcytosine-specific restriction endonuclease McrA